MRELLRGGWNDDDDTTDAARRGRDGTAANTTNNNDDGIVEKKKKGVKKEEEEGEEEKTNSLDSLERRPWRIKSRDEISWINGLNERDAITGEYLFSTYDLSHVVHPRHHHSKLNKWQLDNLDDDYPTSSGKKNDVSGVSSYVTVIPIPPRMMNVIMPTCPLNIHFNVILSLH